MSAKEMAKRAAVGVKNAAAAARAAREAAAERVRQEENRAVRDGQVHYYKYCMEQIEAEADRGKRSTSYYISTTENSPIGTSAEALAAKLRKEGYAAKVGGWATRDADMGDSAAPCHVTIHSVNVEVSW